MLNISLYDLYDGITMIMEYSQRSLVGEGIDHDKRVTFLSLKIGQQLKFPENTLINLIACSILHDNALSEYLLSEYIQRKEKVTDIDLMPHCILGERNISQLPFYTNAQNVILYHHEQANGKGPFRKETHEVPLLARIIFLANEIDLAFDLTKTEKKTQTEIFEFASSNVGILFEQDMVDAFKLAFSNWGDLYLPGNVLDGLIKSNFPPLERTYTEEEIVRISSIVSCMVDCKSPFTLRHSNGLANKAAQMATFYGWDRETQTLLYLAGAVHDIGKLIVDEAILNKSEALTVEEYQHLQKHAFATYEILTSVRGLEEIAPWAYLHHERLDGSGYPFGKTAAQLNHKERLIACLDVYQALTEARPYRKEMSHAAAIDQLRKMADDGKLDAAIIEDINSCFSPVSP